MRQDVQPTYKKLKSHLESLIKTYRVLLEHVSREKESLITLDIEDLRSINQEKAVLLEKIKETEDERILVVAEFAEKLGLQDENVRLFAIADALPENEGNELRSIHSTLDLLLQRVSDLNKSNAILAKNAADCASGAILDIQKTLQGENQPTYQRKGKMQGTGSSGNLVRKEV